MFLHGFREMFRHYGHSNESSDWTETLSLDNLQSTWVNCTQGAGATLHRHAHEDNLFAGVYYINVKPTEGILRLYDPQWAGNKLPYLQTNEFHIPPKTALMALWPANLWHDYVPFDHSEPRVVVVSNFRKTTTEL